MQHLNNEKRSLSTLYFEKIYNILEENDILYILRIFLLTFISISLISLSVFPKETIELLKKGFLYENIIFWKSFVIFYLVFNYEEIFERIQFQFYWIVKNINKVKRQVKRFEKKSDSKICWINIVDLLDHLTQEKTFKIIDIEKKFWIPRNQNQALWKRLEEIWILKRGDFNSKILNEEYSQEQIMKALLYANWEINKIEIQLEKSWSNFSREPLNKNTIN